jgi:hypothetical protein
MYNNIVTSAPAAFSEVRENLLDSSNVVALIGGSMEEPDLTPLDQVNGFLLSSDWKKNCISYPAETLYKHLALTASVLYARENITSLRQGDDDDMLSTEAVWPNFGIVPHIQCENGDILIRTLHGSLSQETNALQMILAAKHWTFVIGLKPKSEHSIMSQRHFYEVKHYERTMPIGLGITPIPRPVADSNNTMVLSNPHQRETFLDMFREFMSRSDAPDIKMKPEQRKLTMMIMRREWKSLLSLPLCRRNENNTNSGRTSFREHIRTIHIGKITFRIDDKNYTIEEHRNRAIEEALDVIASYD